MSEKILPVSEEEYMRMKAVIIDHDRDDAFLLIKAFLKRLELQQQKGLKSHLEC